MTVSWAVPESDGGSPITGYYVEKKESTSSRWSKVNKTPVKETTLRVKDLTEKTKYQFRVSAENKAGVGPESEPSGIFMAKPPFGKLSSFNVTNLFVHVVSRVVVLSSSACNSWMARPPFGKCVYCNATKLFLHVCLELK